MRLFEEDPRSLPVRRRTGVMLQIATVPETLRVAEHVDLFIDRLTRIARGSSVGIA